MQTACDLRLFYCIKQIHDDFTLLLITIASFVVIANFTWTHFHMAKHTIAEKLIIQSILSKSHTNPDFLAQLAHLQKLVVMLV